MARLDGKKILVTGGSRGIGAGIAAMLAGEGATVALTYSSSSERAEKVVADLPGEGHFCLPLKLTETDSIQEAFSQALERFEGLDGLVNNAGITRDQLLLRMKDEEFDDVVQTNLRGTFLCVKKALKPMMKKRAGSIVNVSSVIARMGNPGQSNYAASKAGIEGFTRSVAQEVGSRGIRVNCVAPGFIATDMTDSLDDDQKKALQEHTSLKRLGQVEDVAYAVTYLLSDESSYITGHTLAVNGGLYM